MAASLTLPELLFLSPHTTPKNRLFFSHISVSRNLRCRPAFRNRIRAVSDEGLLVEERERQLIKQLKNGNGAATGNASYGLSTEGYSNGSVGVSERENGSLVKHVNGNGVAAAELVEEEDTGSKEEGRKRRIEEIGKEDAWFKRSGKESIEVN